MSKAVAMRTKIVRVGIETMQTPTLSDMIKDAGGLRFAPNSWGFDDGTVLVYRPHVRVRGVLKWSKCWSAYQCA